MSHGQVYLPRAHVSRIKTINCAICTDFNLSKRPTTPAASCERRCGMSIISEKSMSDLAKLFPELTVKQLEVTVLFSYGMSIEDISALRNVSVTNTRKLLKASIKALHVFTSNALRCVFLTRISLNQSITIS